MTDDKAVAQKMEHSEEEMKTDMPGMNYILDFEKLDELEELEHERKRLMKRGQQFMDMLKMAQEMTDIETIRNGMGRMMRKAGYMKPYPTESKEEKAVMKTEGGVKYPASDFAYVPDAEKPSEWKLRLAEGEPGKITRSQLGAASAALSPGGFRGNQVKLPSSAVAGVKRRIRQEYEKLGVDKADMPDSVKETIREWHKDGEAVERLALSKLKQRGSFQLWKEGDNLRWLAVYSNKFRDNDNPPEIISEASHKNFADMVDKGQAAYPELWYWHVPGTRFGVADYVAYDNSGFALASGIVDPGKEEIAQNIAKENNQLVSHGMPTAFIERDEQDPSIITQHITTEISVLPAQMAANKLTNFIVNRSEDKGMSLPQEKAETLRDLGFNVDEIQQGLEAKAKDAVDSGIEYKETETVVEEVLEVEVEADYVTQDDLKTLIGDMAETIKALKTEIAELKQTQAEGVEEQLKQTPAASLSAIWQSAIGSEEAKVDGRTTLAKSAPEETPPGNLSNNSTLPTLVNGLVNNSRQGWNQ